MLFQNQEAVEARCCSCKSPGQSQARDVVNQPQNSLGTIFGQSICSFPVPFFLCSHVPEQMDTDTSNLKAKESKPKGRGRVCSRSEHRSQADKKTGKRVVLSDSDDDFQGITYVYPATATTLEQN